MEFTYSKYAIAYPYLDRPETATEDGKGHHIFMPDQILEALETAILPLAETHRQVYEKDVAAKNHPPLFVRDAEDGRNRIVIKHPRLSWETSCAMAQETAQLIDLTLAQSVDKAVQQNWIKAQQVKPGFSGGVGDQAKTAASIPQGHPATIHFTYDKTISDPVYLTHEVGHFAAWDQSKGRHGKGGNFQTCRATGEVQAFFFQHAFYDPSLHPHRSAQLAKAVAFHQKAENLNILGRIEYEFAAFNQSRLVQGEDRFSTQGRAQLNQGYLLHTDIHSAPYFIGAGLWNKFKTMEREQRAHFLSVLYPDAARAPETKNSPALDKILSVAGINAQEDLNAFMKESAEAVLSAPPEPQLPARGNKLRNLLHGRA